MDSSSSTKLIEILAAQSYGTVLLVLTALGRGRYGLYCWVLAAYGRWRQRIS